LPAGFIRSEFTRFAAAGVRLFFAEQGVRRNGRKQVLENYSLGTRRCTLPPPLSGDGSDESPVYLLYRTLFRGKRQVHSLDYFAGVSGLSEFRCDPISGRQVIIAPLRSGRPAAFAKAGGGDGRGSKPAYVENCPFCAGNEQMTPPELFALGRNGTAPDTAGWRVRVVPNKYPAGGIIEWWRQISENIPGYGAHEVLSRSRNITATRQLSPATDGARC